MPTGKCKGCGNITNSTTSNWWFTKDFKPTECYAAWDGKKWIKGCAYDKANEYEKQWADHLIKE